MERSTRRRVEDLRQEIADIQRLNLAHFQSARRLVGDVIDFDKREEKLREIMEELNSMRHGGLTDF